MLKKLARNCLTLRLFWSNAAVVIDKGGTKAEEVGRTTNVNSIDPTVILISAVAAIQALSQKNEKLEKDISRSKKQSSL